jgi:hypothetical protein
MCLMVLILSFFKGTKDIKTIDAAFLVTAFIALVLWWFAKQPLISAVLITVVDLLGFAPTIRKSWIRPYSETPIFYYINSFRFLLAILALRQYSIITAIYPITWLIVNSSFAAVLYIRRKQTKPD